MAQTINASKALVNEVMKTPLAVQSLAQLQTYSRGTVDHSVNVSILAGYLALQMGYSHQMILEHVATGALLHDIGKPHVPYDDSDDETTYQEKMKIHPTIGAEWLRKASKVPQEVIMIVEQHHESFDGKGYPKALRGNNIYDLARIVTIANVFDDLVANGQGNLLERQRRAIRQLDEVHYKQFDPQKLEKAIRILKMGV